MKFFTSTALSLVLMLLATATITVAQDNNVGIGTITPHPDAMLDIDSDAGSKGLLIPRMNTVQRLLLAPNVQSDGLMVYDTDLDQICYWDENDAQWTCIGGIGNQGPTGPTGAQGVQGVPGPPGPAGANGATGPVGAAGPTGPAGLPGPTGANGANGLPGATGPAGANGATGATGPAGTPGSNGATGPTGPTGANGTNGVTGPTGPTGPVNLSTGIIAGGGTVLAGNVSASTSATGVTNVTFNTPFTGGTPTVLVTPVGSLSGGGGGTIPPATVCDPCYTNGTDDWITNVTFNTINNNTGQDGGCSYGDYTNLNTTVDIGSTYNLSVTFFSDGTWTEFVSVWFDWNQNGDFEPGERTDLGSGIDATLNVNITVPATALPGPTRMRVNEDWNGYATDACNTAGSGFGETEDYTVIVSSGGGGLNVCNVSSVTTAGFQCDCSDLTGTAVDATYHFSAFGN